MSTTMPAVQGLKKRKRTDTAGGLVAVVNSSSFEAPPAWAFFLQNVPAANTSPPAVLAVFARLYHNALTGYRSALKQHHRILAARDRFTVESNGDSVPVAISNTLKGPMFLFPKDISAEAEELTKGAQEQYMSALKVMKSAAVDFVRACHEKNVEASRTLIDAESKGACLSVDLQSYASQIIKDAGYADDNIWNAYINAVVSAMGAELNGIRFDIAVLVRAEREEKAAKQATLTTATTDAEMQDGTQPIVFESPSVEEKGQGAARERKWKRKRKRKGGIHRRAGREAEIEEVETLGVKRHRLDASHMPPPIPHLITTWTPPPGIKFHCLKPETYPPIFFSAPLTLQSRFITARMSPLFYDTRITNRTFHNMTSVKLSYEQVKMLALNSKFVCSSMRNTYYNKNLKPGSKKSSLPLRCIIEPSS
ncbi:uncharacterized protein LACBIDRAFT_327583 [Laccaria bicolor S238N-H82]|uniref:Predicted protein n=1 Tax=Laccaria bicolor (strain S238N-H82 / ATCC MYA-4686) TaxID=486041 RepID=B0DC70_LACBS|nr:uncharacterized protein LACBIDRAFT_327583 [Laccaria bicolor S238N-H82]EDR07844.1 predicted protein [Laccaria bicolor S238N-H82]|eukprot:XP_001881633.1 predicted protein [Laccaria bicolor S238N-H82]